MDYKIAHALLLAQAELLRQFLMHLYFFAFAVVLGVAFGLWWSLIPIGFGFTGLCIGFARAAKP